MKVCFRCKVSKPKQEFNRSSYSKDSLYSVCKECQHERANSEYRKAYLGEYRKNHKADRADEARRYRAKIGEAYREQRRKIWAKNKEHYIEYRLNYIKENPGFNRAASARNRALRLQRTPAWVDRNKLKDFYKACPEGMVVDHIVPLRGKTVSGLHVPYNLQYLTAEQNGKKSNKLIVNE